MKSAMPWSIKGIEPEAREAAKLAARRAGMTLGQWLNTVILEGDEYDEPAPRGGHRVPHRRAAGGRDDRRGESDSELHERLDDLSAQLAHLARRQSDTAVSRVIRPTVDLDPVSDLVRGLAERLERSESRSASLVEEFNRRLDAMTEAHAPEPQPDQTGEALRKVVDHVERTEARMHEAVRGLQGKISDLGSRLSRPPEPQVKPQVVSQIERRLAELAERIERAEHTSRNADFSAALKSMDQRISQLGASLRDQLHAVSALADEARQAGAADASEFARHDDLQEIRDRLSQTDHLRGFDPAAVARRDDLAAIRHRLEETDHLRDLDTEAFARRDEMDRIQARIEQIVTRLDDNDAGASDELLERMQQEIATLSRSLSDLQIEAASASELNALSQAIGDISAQLSDSAHAAGDSGEAFARLEDEIAALSRNIADLTIEAASNRDVTALRRDLDQMRERLGKQSYQSGPAEEAVLTMQSELDSLQSMVTQIRENAASSNELYSLRAAVEQISERLGEHDPAGGDAAALRGLEQRLDEVAQRLETVQPDVAPHVAALQARLDELEDSLRDGAAAQASSAAERAVESRMAELSAQLERSQSGERDDALNALEEHVRQIQLSAEAADRRTQDTLEAVHDTLGQVVARLARLEDQGTPAPAGDGTADDADLYGGEATPALTGSDVADLDDLILPPLDLDEPSGAAPREDAREPRWADKARSEAGTGDTPRGPDLSKITRTDDFIAAARRAAMAAAEPAPRETGARSARSRFLPGARKAAGAHGDAGKGRKKTILLAAAAALLAIGALSTMQLVKGKKPVAQQSGKVLPGGAAKSKSKLSSGTPSPLSGSVPREAAGKPAPRVKLDRPLNPLAALPRRNRTGGGISEIAKTSLAHAPAAGVPPKGERRADPVQTGSISGSLKDTQFTAGRLGSGASGSAVPSHSSLLKRDQPLAPLGGKAEDPRHSDTARQIKKIMSALPRAVAPDEDRATKVKAPAPPAPAPTMATGGAMADLPPAEIGPMALRIAAASGNAAAQFEIAARYTEGKVVAQDLHMAAVWYRKAAAQGLAPAQYRLGTLYEKGRGVAADLTAARIWYERAAEKGNVKAMHNLAVLHANTNAGSPNFTRAAQWFRRAAEHGVTDSQYNYAILAERGLGLPANITEAYKWFAIAADAGDQGSRDRLAVISRKMTDAELADAKMAVEDYEPRPPAAQANLVTTPRGGWAPSSPAPAGEPTTDRSQIAKAQSLLNKLGYDAGPADGRMGPRTRAAIRSFQRDHKMPPTGAVSTRLFRKLESRTG